MNSKNTKTSEPHRPWFNLADKINFKRSGKIVALWNTSMYYKRKNVKKSCNNNNQLTQRVESLIYLID